jgi:hypothetical protein
LSQQIPVASTKPIDVAEERRKPRLLALLFCDYLNWTREDKTNLIGIFDRIYVHPERRATPTFVLFTRSAETTEEGLSVRVFAPDGSPAIALDFAGAGAEVTFTPNLPAHINSTLKIQFQASQEGVYWFHVFYKSEPLGGAGLVVEYRETEERKGGTDTYI